MTSAIEPFHVDATALDDADPLRQYRQRFIDSPGDKATAHLDGNSLGRPLAVTRERLVDFIDCRTRCSNPSGDGWGRRSPLTCRRTINQPRESGSSFTGTPPVLAMQPLKHMLDLIAEAGMPA